MTSVFRSGEGPAASGSSSTKDEGALKKWPNRLADAHERLAWKALEILPGIVGKFVGAILKF